MMSKRQNILPTRASFFISSTSTGKVESVQKFRMKLFRVVVSLQMTVK